MTTIITSLASERFGFVETQQPRRPYTANRRVNKMKDIRKEIRSLKKLYRRESIEERQPLEELRGILRGELKTLRRAEWHMRRRKERSKKRANFLSNPFDFARTLLGEKRNGNLEVSEEEINNHLRDTISDSAKDQNMGINNRLIHQKPPVVQYDTPLANLEGNARSCESHKIRLSTRTKWGYLTLCTSGVKGFYKSCGRY